MLVNVALGLYMQKSELKTAFWMEVNGLQGDGILS
jgi:hypothetical protein